MNELKASPTRSYIQFRNPGDIYIVFPFWGITLSDEPKPALYCPVCGLPLYVPIDLPQNIIIHRPMGNIFRPYPKDVPSLFHRSQAEPTTLIVYTDLNRYQKENLVNLRNIVAITDEYFELLIVDVSDEPKEHLCEPNHPS